MKPQTGKSRWRDPMILSLAASVIFNIGIVAALALIPWGMPDPVSGNGANEGQVFAVTINLVPASGALAPGQAPGQAPLQAPRQVKNALPALPQASDDADKLEVQIPKVAATSAVNRLEPRPLPRISKALDLAQDKTGISSVQLPRLASIASPIEWNQTRRALPEGPANNPSRANPRQVTNQGAQQVSSAPASRPSPQRRTGALEAPRAPAPAGTQATSSATTTSAASSKGDRGVRIVKLAQPSNENPYPRLSRIKGEQGSVVLRIEVLADGSVGRIDVNEAPPYPRLLQFAQKLARISKFAPAIRNGRPERGLIVVPYNFILTKAG